MAGIRTGWLAVVALALHISPAWAQAGDLPPPQPASAAPDEATACLATAIYYEAGFEPREGREAVADVVLNRLADARYPKSVCGVVYQGASRRTGCQFTFTCDGSLARPPKAAAWAEALEIATAALSAPSGRAAGANHYHADYVRPGWARAMREVARIGRHIFYVDGRGPAAIVRAAASATPAAEPFRPWGLSLGALGGS